MGMTRLTVVFAISPTLSGDPAAVSPDHNMRRHPIKIYYLLKLR
jgi:hypothetical protein